MLFHVYTMALLFLLTIFSVISFFVSSMFVSKKNVVILCFNVKAQFQKEVKKRKKTCDWKIV